MWRSDNSNEHDNINKPVQIYIASQLPKTVKLPQVVSLKPFVTRRKQDMEQVLFVVRGNGSLGYCSRKTSHYYYGHCNNDDESYEEEVIDVSSGEESHGHRSLDTSHSSSSNHICCEISEHRYQETNQTSSSNHRCCGHRSSMTIHSASINHGGYVDRGGSSSQETSHYSS